MPSPENPDRIDELKAQWEADPSSRVFVQLADLYRREDRLDEAIEVLEKGLESQPNYVSAQVALGRCRLAAGDPQGAAEMLSQAVEQDPSHPLAGKLLVEVHLRTGDLDQARERLDLYRMIADSDPEISELEQRLRRAEGEGKAVAESEPAAPAAPEKTDDDIFGLGSVDLSQELSPLSAPEASAAPETSPEPSPREPSPQPAVPAAEPFELAEPSAAAAEPFPLEEPAPRRQTEHEATPAEDPFGELLGAEAAAPPDLEGEDVFDLSSGTPKSDEATVTLGRLYMSQGHDEEAARIFRSILRRDPDNEISRRALEELERRQERAGSAEDSTPEAVSPEAVSPEAVPPEAVSPEVVPPETVPETETSEAAVSPETAETEEEPAPAAVASEPPPRESRPPHPDIPPLAAVSGDVVSGEGLTARKIAALEQYLQRLRRGTG